MLLASGPIGSLSPREAAIALARGFDGAAIVAAAGLAEGGPALARALTEPDGQVDWFPSGWQARTPELVGVGAHPSESPDPLTGSSAALGSLLNEALTPTAPATVVVDLGADHEAAIAHDAGAGLLAALGAVADVALDQGPEPLRGLTAIDLDPVRRRLAGRALIGVVRPGQEQDKLLGLRGITSRRGRSLRTAPERMLAIDAALERFAGAVAADLSGTPELARADGGGAAGGLGFAVLALGGRVTTGPALGADLQGLAATIGRADLVVVGCDSFDFGSRGGAVVTELARRCEQAQTPLMVVSPVMGMSGREMRVMGVESAHPVIPVGDEAASLTSTARRLAAGWVARW